MGAPTDTSPTDTKADTPADVSPRPPTNNDEKVEPPPDYKPDDKPNDPVSDDKPILTKDKPPSNMMDDYAKVVADSKEKSKKSGGCALPDIGDVFAKGPKVIDEYGSCLAGVCEDGRGRVLDFGGGM